MTKLEKNFIINLSEGEIAQIQKGGEIRVKVCKSIHVTVKKEVKVEVEL